MPFAPLNGQELFYEDSGGDKPAVVFMHGFLFDTSMFDAQVKALEDHYRCVRFDARAFGQTKWDGKPFTLYDTAADCIALMDYLKIDKAAIVGMSQGGYALVRLAIKYPHRVTALVFMSTYNGVDTEDVKQIYRNMRDTWKNQGPAALLDTYVSLFIGNKDQFPMQAASWRAKWEQVSGDAVVAAMNNLIDRDEITDEQVKLITQPAIVIHGDSDSGMPMALGEALHKLLPNSKGFYPIKGAAHGANVTHPEFVNPILRQFLDEVTQSTSN